jgi:hypothetical protein
MASDLERTMIAARRPSRDLAAAARDLHAGRRGSLVVVESGRLPGRSILAPRLDAVDAPSTQEISNTERTRSSRTHAAAASSGGAPSSRALQQKHAQFGPAGPGRAGRPVLRRRQGPGCIFAARHDLPGEPPPSAAEPAHAACGPGPASAPGAQVAAEEEALKRGKPGLTPAPSAWARATTSSRREKRGYFFVYFL